jgi:hypothetical protein
VGAHRLLGADPVTGKQRYATKTVCAGKRDDVLDYLASG